MEITRHSAIGNSSIQRDMVEKSTRCKWVTLSSNEQGYFLTLVLQNPDMPLLANSVDQDKLISSEAN